MLLAMNALHRAASFFVSLVVVLPFFPVALSAAETAATSSDARGIWPPTGDLSAPSYACGATLLSDGNVLLAGRAGNSDSTNSQLYEVATGKWMLTCPLNERRFGLSLTLLADGNSTRLEQRRTTRLILSSANSSPVRGNGA